MILAIINSDCDDFMDFLLLGEYEKFPSDGIELFLENLSCDNISNKVNKMVKKVFYENEFWIANKLLQNNTILDHITTRTIKKIAQTYSGFDLIHRLLHTKILNQNPILFIIIMTNNKQIIPKEILNIIILYFLQNEIKYIYTLMKDAPQKKKLNIIFK